MTEPLVSREHLEQVLELAQVYRGWTRKQLATALGRDVSNLVPASGIPKVDLVMRLAQVLEWPVEEVISGVSAQQLAGIHAGDTQPDDYSVLISESLRAHRQGRYREMLRLAQRATIVADSPSQRALALHRESGAYDGLGYVREAYVATRRALYAHTSDSAAKRATLSNLANAQYGLWELDDARRCTTGLLSRYEADPPDSRQERVTEAFSLYVRGNANRRSVSKDLALADRYARAAHDDLTRAIGLFEELSVDFDEPSYLGVARTCTGALMEAEVVLAHRDPECALAEFTSWMESSTHGDSSPVGDHLESLGWCCVFAANVVLRHIDDPREQQHLMAIFTNKADEIASHLENWAIRERILAMEVERRRRLGDWTGLEIPWTLDAEDLRTIAGVMGRFPSFRQTGWLILEHATIVRDGRGGIA